MKSLLETLVAPEPAWLPRNRLPPPVTLAPAFAPIAMFWDTPDAFCSAFCPMAMLLLPEKEFCSAFWPIATFAWPDPFVANAPLPTTVLLKKLPPPRPTRTLLMKASLAVDSVPLTVRLPPIVTAPVSPAMTMRTLLSVAMTRLLDDLVPRNWPVGASPMSAAVLVLVMVLPSVRHAASVSVRLSARGSAETTRPKTSRVTRGRLRMVLTTPVTGLVDWPRPPKMPETVGDPARFCSGTPAFAPLPRIVARPSSGLPATPSALPTTSWLVTPWIEREPTAAPVLTSSPGCEGGNAPSDCTSVGT